SASETSDRSGVSEITWKVFSFFEKSDGKLDQLIGLMLFTNPEIISKAGLPKYNGKGTCKLIFLLFNFMCQLFTGGRRT
uniref:Uncharacterized protein n=1 Tax=Romanomermis culicivorax TaxID=13658 RepID=A0A915L3J4_ROMCU